MVVVPVLVDLGDRRAVGMLSEQFGYSFPIIQDEGLAEMFVNGFEGFLEERCQTSRTE